MPKTTRADGPSIAGGTPNRQAVRISGRDVEIGGPTAELITGSATIGTLAATTMTVATETVTNQTVTNLDTTTLDVAGAATHRGMPFAHYQRLTFLGSQMNRLTDEAPTYVEPTTALPYGGWDFAPNVNTSVMWPFAPPRVGLDGTNDIFWGTYNIAVIWLNLGATGGNARWRARVRNLAIAIDAVTDTPSTDVTTTTAAAGQNVINAFQVAVTVPIVPAFFGSEYSLVITRMGAEGTDTLEQTARLGMCSFNQAS